MASISTWFLPEKAKPFEVDPPLPALPFVNTFPKSTPLSCPPYPPPIAPLNPLPRPRDAKADPVV